MKTSQNKDDKRGNYFADAVQPIKFVTADSLDPEFDQVLIRVGTDLSGYSRPIGGGAGKEKILTEKQKELNTQFEKLIAEKKAETEAKKKNEGGTEPQAPVLSQCSTEEEFYGTNGYANVLVGDECDNISTNHSEINYMLQEQPEFFKVPHSDEEELKLVELIQVCNDETHPHQNGGSIPVDYKRYRYNYSTSSFENSWRLEPYKGTDGRVHYYLIDPQTNQDTPLLFDFVTGVCYWKINPPGSNPPKILIDNLSDVSDPTKIPSNDYEQAFFDFCGHLCYPNERAVYVLTEIIRTHEREHMNDFAGIVSESFPQLVEDIKSYSDLCQSYNETVRKNAEKVIYYKIVRFIDNAKNRYNVISGEPGSPEELEHERKIQSRTSITNRIEDYKDALKMRFKVLKEKDCQKCLYE